MRKATVLFCLGIVLSGCTPKYMVKVDDCPDVRAIKPPAGKAALVIAETSRYENYDMDDNPDIHHFLDRRFIGTIRSYSFLVTTVEPGDHYVTANGENFETILLHFEPGKTYYLEQQRSMGIHHPRTRYLLVKADRIHGDMKDNRSCYKPDPQNPGTDLDEDRFAEAVANYVKKNGSKPVNSGQP